MNIGVLEMEPSFAPKHPQEPTKLCPQKSPNFSPKCPQEPPDADDLTPTLMTTNPNPQPLPIEQEFFVNVEPTCVVIFQIQKQKLFSLI